VSSNVKYDLKKCEIEDFQENGYLIIRNLVNKELLDKQALLVQNCYMRFCKLKSNIVAEKNLWDSPHFHKSLINFRENDPKKFGSFYDALQSSVTLTQLLCNIRL
jgi:hypothetical protein